MNESVCYGAFVGIRERNKNKKKKEHEGRKSQTAKFQKGRSEVNLGSDRNERREGGINERDGKEAGLLAVSTLSMALLLILPSAVALDYGLSAVGL